MSLLPLSRLLPSDRDGDIPVARRRGETVTLACLRRDVGAFAAQDDQRPAALICTDSYNFLVGLLGLLQAGRRVALPPDGQDATLQRLQDAFEMVVDDRAVLAARDGHGSVRPFNADVPALHFFTSGSTGVPKRIVKTLGMFERELDMIDAVFGEKAAAAQVILSTVPHHHVYGLTFRLLWPLAMGKPFNAETFGPWEPLLARLPEGAIIVSSPAHLSRLGGLPPMKDRPPLILSAGAPLFLPAVRDTEAVFGVMPDEIFGSTETGAIATRQQRVGGEAWRLLPGVAVSFADDGTMSVRSPAMDADWLATQDIATLAPDGFHYRGRADRVVKVEGKRVDLREVEQALISLPDVADAAAILLPSGDLGAALALKGEARARLAQIGAFRFSLMLRRALVGPLEGPSLPRRWRFPDSLPRGDLGKRRGADISALFEDTP